MNGPEHYREAERLLRGVQDPSAPSSAQDVAIAQVHATLALAAATIGTRRGDVLAAWERAFTNGTRRP